MSDNNEERVSFDHYYMTDRMWEIVIPVLIGAVLYALLFFFSISFLTDKLNIYVQVVIFFMYAVYALKITLKNLKEIIIGDRRDTLMITVNIKNIVLQLVSIILFAFILITITYTYPLVE